MHAAANMREGACGPKCCASHAAGLTSYQHHPCWFAHSLRHVIALSVVSSVPYSTQPEGQRCVSIWHQDGGSLGLPPGGGPGVYGDGQFRQHLQLDSNSKELL